MQFFQGLGLPLRKTNKIPSDHIHSVLALQTHCPEISRVILKASKPWAELLQQRFSAGRKLEICLRLFQAAPPQPPGSLGVSVKKVLRAPWLIPPAIISDQEGKLEP